MARFARDCLYKMQCMSKQLEVALGPDTADLEIRIGLHSGPVTAGVLRGERSRFQLFGDTVNTASRVETTGSGNRIHISSDTAELLMAAGKGHWLRQRQDKVEAKGKGELTTYWLDLRGESGQSTTSGTSSESYDGATNMKHAPAEEGKIMPAIQSVEDHHDAVPHELMSDKINRLIDWNKELMAKLLKEVVARREAAGVQAESASRMEELEQEKMYRDTTVLEEVIDIITLPQFDPSVAHRQKSADSIELDEKVMMQLRDFVQTIAAMYNENPFHNFEHASHVTMSVVKLLSRVVAPDLDDDDDDDYADSTLHDHTYGITSDPLTQFAVVFSAIIHDLDHPGVPNMTLINEQSSTAIAYKNKSVAEQNSVDLALDLLMDPSFLELRRTIYTTESEFRRFRQLVVNTVMATDIMDKDLSTLRKDRWNKAFSAGECSKDVVAVNRKATIVIEHLIQASDVAHTMQHWHIYRKWNSRFFEEMRRAFKEGRSDNDPAQGWYKGEIGFFDFYVIPLAKKLKECGVFGVSSDEYLNYAQQNRQEWELKGEGLVAEMLEQEEK